MIFKVANVNLVPITVTCKTRVWSWEQVRHATCHFLRWRLSNCQGVFKNRRLVNITARPSIGTGRHPPPRIFTNEPVPRDTSVKRKKGARATSPPYSHLPCQSATPEAKLARSRWRNVVSLIPPRTRYFSPVGRHLTRFRQQMSESENRNRVCITIAGPPPPSSSSFSFF